MISNNIRIISILSLLVCFSVTSLAQQNILVWKDGKYSVKVADSITFVDRENENICIWLDSSFTYVAADSISKRYYNAAIPFNTNGHEYVDLGLESGIYWATANVGESGNSIVNYFRWASITPNYRTCDVRYPYESYSDKEPTKYNTNKLGYHYDGKSELDLSDDAANAIMGGSWRMPSEEEAQELIESCTWSSDIIDGVKVTIGIGPNGNKIVIPKNEYYWCGNVYYMDDTKFWLKTVTYSDHAKVLAFDSLGVGRISYERRDNQFCIRGVCNPNEILIPNTYTLTVNYAKNAGVVIGGGRYKGNTIVPMKIVVNEGYELLGISDYLYVSTDITVNVSYDTDLSVVFISKDNAEDGEANGFSYVDMGLPSGIFWATRNYGATALEEEGDFFTWGEVATKDNYSCDNLTAEKYSDTELEPTTDAAYINMGENWKTPSSDDWKELIDNTYHIVTKINGVTGYQLVSKINGKWIFLPRFNSKSGEGRSNVNDYHYLCSTKYKGDLYMLYEASRNELYFTQHTHLELGSCSGYCDGYPLRAVYRK